MWGGRGGRGACACACGGGGGGGGGVILGEVKARPKDIISFSLDYISKSKVQTSNPSSSPIPLDTPARPADSRNEKPLEPNKTHGKMKILSPQKIWVIYNPLKMQGF